MQKIKFILHSLAETCMLINVDVMVMMFCLSCKRISVYNMLFVNLHWEAMLVSETRAIVHCCYFNI